MRLFAKWDSLTTAQMRTPSSHFALNDAMAALVESDPVPAPEEVTTLSALSEMLRQRLPFGGNILDAAGVLSIFATLVPCPDQPIDEGRHYWWSAATSEVTSDTYGTRRGIRDCDVEESIRRNVAAVQLPSETTMDPPRQIDTCPYTLVGGWTPLTDFVWSTPHHQLFDEYMIV